MIPAPMRPVQNLLAIGALFLVAGALLPWGATPRIVCSGAAIAIAIGLCISRLQMHAGDAQSRTASDTQARIDRIRAERAARMDRRG